MRKILTVLILTIFTSFVYGTDLDKKLVDAVKANDYKEVRNLLVRGANPDAKDSMGNTTLVMAVNNGNEEIAEVLIRALAYPSESYMRGMSVLMLAINKQMEPTALLLIRYSADTTAKLSNGSNALMMACERNMEGIVKEILQRRQVDVNTKTVQGITALSIAFKERNINIAKMLHEYGAKPLNLSEAAFISDIQSAAKLIEYGADLEMRDEKGRTALINAFLLEDYAMANFLISKGADINARDYFGMSPVLIASMANNGALLALCLDNKSDVLVKDVNGLNSLMFLVFFENDSLIDSLINYNEKTVNCVDNNYTTPLVIAISKGNKRIIEKLISRGAYINSKRSRRALNVAIEIGNLEIAQYVLDKGARINAKDFNGNAPIITAASMNNTEAVKFLVLHKAKTNVRDFSGLTPLDYATKFSNKAIISILNGDYSYTDEASLEK